MIWEAAALGVVRDDSFWMSSGFRINKNVFCSERNVLRIEKAGFALRCVEQTRNHAPAAKAVLILLFFLAGLKPRPFKTRVFREAGKGLAMERA